MRKPGSIAPGSRSNKNSKPQRGETQAGDGFPNYAVALNRRAYEGRSRHRAGLDQPQTYRSSYSIPYFRNSRRYSFWNVSVF